MITVEYREADKSYIIEQDGEFIKDTEYLCAAIEFALAVGDNSCDHVCVTSLKPL